MALEIERKWLIDPQAVPFDLERAERTRIEQSYVSFKPQVRLRSLNDERFILTVKGKPLGEPEQESELARQEFEFELTREAYENLRGKTEGKVLRKTRYFVPQDQGRCFEIDIYEGEFAGLAVAEMEFATLEQAESFPTPDWVLEDISADPYYRNVVMAQE